MAHNGPHWTTRSEIRWHEAEVRVDYTLKWMAIISAILCFIPAPTRSAKLGDVYGLVIPENASQADR
jgi:hypothetical protein